MKQRPTRACVIGAGLAGLASALAAASGGLHVQLFDAAVQAQSLPAYIEVVPNMLRDLAAFGVAEECVRAGFPYRGIDVIDRQGIRLHELPTENLAGPRFPAALGIGYADLHHVLERAAVGRGVAMRRGARVQEVQEHGEHARVVLAGGESIEADLVVLAAGVGAELRTALFPHAEAAIELGQAWWYALLRRPVDLDRPLIAFGSAGRRAVLMPVRHDLAGIALTEPMPAGQRPSPAEHLRGELSAFAPRLRSLAAQIDSGTPTVLRPVRSALLESPWYRGCVLAVGDAAHAFPPHFGQGAAQAIEDARVLADLLHHMPHRDELFEGFQRRRAERVRKVHDIAATAARWDLEPDSSTDLSLLMQRLMRTVAHPA